MAQNVVYNGGEGFTVLISGYQSLGPVRTGQTVTVDDSTAAHLVAGGCWSYSGAAPDAPIPTYVFAPSYDSQGRLLGLTTSTESVASIAYDSSNRIVSLFHNGTEHIATYSATGLIGVL